MKKIVLLIALFSFTLGFSQMRFDGDVEIFPTIGTTQSGASFFTNTRSSIRAGVLGVII